MKNRKYFIHATKRWYQPHVSFRRSLVNSPDSIIRRDDLCAWPPLVHTHINFGHNPFLCLVNTKAASVINASVLGSLDAFSLWCKGAGPCKCISIQLVEEVACDFSCGTGLSTTPRSFQLVAFCRYRLMFPRWSQRSSNTLSATFPWNTFATYATETDN